LLCCCCWYCAVKSKWKAVGERWEGGEYFCLQKFELKIVASKYLQGAKTRKRNNKPSISDGGTTGSLQPAKSELTLRWSSISLRDTLRNLTSTNSNLLRAQKQINPYLIIKEKERRSRTFSKDDQGIDISVYCSHTMRAVDVDSDSSCASEDPRNMSSTKLTIWTIHCGTARFKMHHLRLRRHVEMNPNE